MPTRRSMTKKPAARKAGAKTEPKTKAGAKAPPPGKGRSAKAAKEPGREKAGKGAKAPPGSSSYDVAAELLESFATSNRITSYLIENLAEAAWHAAPPGGRGRSIAAIVAHMHNVRLRWLDAARRASKGTRPPPKFDHLAASKDDAVKALDASSAAIAKVVGAALRGDGEVPNFKAGAAALLYYMMTHDAHHRGQICLQAKLVGHPLPTAVGHGMWEWSKR
jgi:uncharacterized damage-inducible protein DinB